MENTNWHSCLWEIFRKQEEFVVSVEIISLISLPCSEKVRTKSQSHPEYPAAEVELEKKLHE